MPPGTIDIAEVSRTTGLPASTLRYYEEKGLIRSVGRKGLKRLFDTAVIERLALVSLGRHAGFTLDEIGAMFAEGGQPQIAPRIDRAELARKADEIDHNIRKLTAMRDGLRHAAECPAPSHMDCPTFQRLIRVAGKRPPRRG